MSSLGVVGRIKERSVLIQKAEEGGTGSVLLSVCSSNALLPKVQIVFGGLVKHVAIAFLQGGSNPHGTDELQAIDFHAFEPRILLSNKEIKLLLKLFSKKSAVRILHIALGDQQSGARDPDDQ